MKNARSVIPVVVLVFCLCSQTVFAAAVSQVTTVVAALGTIDSRTDRPFIVPSPGTLNYSDPLLGVSGSGSSSLTSTSFGQFFELLPPSSTGILPPIDAFTIRTTNTSGFKVKPIHSPAYSPNGYSLEAIGYEQGGSGGLELYEWLSDGTMVLLGDVANGASPVYVPEPATIALLGLGCMALHRSRRP